jgi:hypothetical protein
MLGDNEERYALSVAGLTGRARSHQQVRGEGCRHDDGFATGDSPLRAVPRSPRRDVARVEAACRLAPGKGHDRLTRNDCGDEIRRQRATDAFEKAGGDHDGFQVRLDGESTAELFHQNHRFDGTAAKAAVLFRQSRA